MGQNVRVLWKTGAWQLIIHLIVLRKREIDDLYTLPADIPNAQKLERKGGVHSLRASSYIIPSFYR